MTTYTTAEYRNGKTTEQIMNETQNLPCEGGDTKIKLSIGYKHFLGGFETVYVEVGVERMVHYSREQAEHEKAYADLTARLETTIKDLVTQLK